MIKTKHLLVFFIVFCLFLSGIIAALVFDAAEEPVPETAVEFSTSSDSYTVRVSQHDTRESIRESLISKLQNRPPKTTDTPDTANEEESTEESEVGEEGRIEDVPQNGVLLGDGKVSVAPREGHVFACNAGPGGNATGPWVKDGYWVPSEKPVVDGVATWSAEHSITSAEGARIISTNGLPDHETGVFPISPADDARQYDQNEFTISAQNILLQLPASPSIAGAPSCLPSGVIGIGLNGVPIYSALNADGQDALAREMLDACGAHPDANGRYHYHGESTCLLESVYEGAANTLVGYALDGFGIFSGTESGETVTNSDLDACHGHTHQIPWNGSIIALYHYHMTDAYPYSLGCFMGTPRTIESGPPPATTVSQTATGTQVTN